MKKSCFNFAANSVVYRLKYIFYSITRIYIAFGISRFLPYMQIVVTLCVTGMKRKIGT